MISKTNYRKTQIFSDRKQRFYDFLRSCPVGVLSTVTPDGEPHGVVIYFTVDKDFTISFLTKTDTRKITNLRYNNHVMLTVYEPRTQSTVQVTGKAEEIKDSYEINNIAGGILNASMLTSDGGVPPFTKLEAGSYVGFRIIPLQLRMAVYARPDTDQYTDLFESIESFDLENKV